MMIGSRSSSACPDPSGTARGKLDVAPEGHANAQSAVAGGMSDSAQKANLSH
ncbi:MAG: hypothetical protein J4G05_03040 [Chlorobi bacterium]|nr:hypothetical protein [Chlorobiota bacterium]